MSQSQSKSKSVRQSTVVEVPVAASPAPASPTPAETFAIGMDVSRDFLDVGEFPARTTSRVAYNTEAIVTLVQKFQLRTPEILVLEATGGIEQLIVAELAAAGLPVVVINPKRVRDFAKERRRNNCRTCCLVPSPRLCGERGLG